MNEKMDSVRDKKSALRRRIIHKALSHPAYSTLRPHTPLSEEIAFAMSVILPSSFTKRTERNTEERRKVVKEVVNELINPSFEDIIKIFAATSLMSRIVRKYCLIRTSCLTGLFDISILLHI